MIQKIILDTNFLLIPAQFKVDIFSEIDRICDFKYKIFILDKSIKELKDIINKQKGKAKKNADIALQLIKFKKLTILKTKGDKIVDDQILELTKNNQYIIATQDKELIKKLKKQKARIITLRQKKYLIIKTESF